MAIYYAELTGGDIVSSASFEGGTVVADASFSGGDIYPGGGGGGGGNLTTLNLSYTPSETAISDTQTPPPGYDGFDEVNVSVDAISSTYVGSAIPQNDSSDLTASGATVTAPAGYYASNATKTIASGSATTPSTTIQTNPNMSLNAVTGLMTASYTKTQSVTPTVSAGYISTGTAGTVLAYGNATYQLDTQAAQTIYPSSSDQTIAADKYLTGAQTIKGVTTTNLTAANIVNGVTVEVGDADDPDRVASVTGTAAAGFDFWNKAQPTGAQSTTRTSISAYVAYGRTGITSLSAPNATSINDYSLYGCTGLTSVSLPVCTSTGAQSMRGCTNLLSVSLPELQIVGGATGSTSKTHLLYGCTKLTDVWMPKVYYFQGYEFAGCSALTGLDFPKLKTIKGNAFSSCSNLKVLILRRNEVASVSNINSFSSTPFASGGSGGTLYVPQSLISSYQSASVWSTLLGYANNSIEKIEGSPYENYYYNGSPIT